MLLTVQTQIWTIVLWRMMQQVAGRNPYIPSVTAGNTDDHEGKDFAPIDSVDQSLNRIREQFSERTLREIQRTRKRMHDMADKNRGRYLNLTKQYLGLDKEDIDSGDESGDEAFDDDVNKRKEQLYAETIDDAGLSVLYRVDDEQKTRRKKTIKKQYWPIDRNILCITRSAKKLRRRKSSNLDTAKGVVVV